jgi:hypothetical protein
MEWEQIDEYHKRARIAGGWLVKAYEAIWEYNAPRGEYQDIGNFRVSMCFVPDENHEWEVHP